MRTKITKISKFINEKLNYSPSSIPKFILVSLIPRTQPITIKKYQVFFKTLHVLHEAHFIAQKIIFKFVHCNLFNFVIAAGYFNRPPQEMRLLYKCVEVWSLRFSQIVSSNTKPEQFFFCIQVHLFTTHLTAQFRWNN